MQIDWVHLAGALVLLLTPIALFQGGRVRFRDIERDWAECWRRILALGTHTIDFFRAALGAWILSGSILVDPGAHGSAHYAPLLVTGAIQLLAVLLQTAICREPDSANAPFAFVTGLMLGGLSPLVAVFALVLATTIALGSRTAVAYFPVLAAAAAGTALLFGGVGLVVGMAPTSAAVTIPWVWSLLFHRTLVISCRKTRQAETTPPI